MQNPTFTSDQLIYVLLAKTPEGDIHQVVISQEKVKANLHNIIIGDHVQLVETKLDGITIEKPNEDGN